MDLWIALQLSDSAFPTGAFAHSFGLEAAFRLGRILSPKDALAFVEESLWSAGSLALPFVLAAARSGEKLSDLDARCDAALAGHVANRASRAQGRAFLRSAAEAFGDELEELARHLERSLTAFHLAPIFGAVTKMLGATPREASELFLFGHARSTLSAGVRLGVMGPFEAQRGLCLAGEVVRDVLRTFPEVLPGQAATNSPLVDLLQGYQDRLYSRLFQS